MEWNYGCGVSLIGLLVMGAARHRQLAKKRDKPAAPHPSTLIISSLSYQPTPIHINSPWVG